MLNYKKIQTKLLPSLSALALLNTSIYTGVLNGQDTVEEIVVTARKKSESLQDVPLSVSALRESDLEEKGVNVFEDYLLQLPGVTAGGSGPGQSTIYIRGLASTTPNLTTGLGEVTVGWSSSVTLYEHQYKCVVRENEFGYSLNPSVLSGSQVNAPLGVNNVYKDFATGSYFSPYITTV